MYGRAWGKLILCGEHAVVYGYPAMASAVDRGLEVALSPVEGPTRLVGGIADASLRMAMELALPEYGVAMRISSTIPQGRGMGSSAALSVAMVRAAIAWQGDCLPEASLVFRRSLALERVFHGNPSGVDNTVAMSGALVYFKKGDAGMARSITPDGPIPLVVLDTGLYSDTAAMVAAVKERASSSAHIFRRMGQLVDLAVGSLHDHAALGGIFDENHSLLQALGVSAPELDELVALARASGALGAKLSGSGGGGVVIALAPEPAGRRLLRRAMARGINAFTVSQPTTPQPVGLPD